MVPDSPSFRFQTLCQTDRAATPDEPGPAVAYGRPEPGNGPRKRSRPVGQVDCTEETTGDQNPVCPGDQAAGIHRAEQLEHIGRQEAVEGGIGHRETWSAIRLSHLCTILPRLQPPGRQSDHGPADVQTDVSSIRRDDRLEESAGEGARASAELQHRMGVLEVGMFHKIVDRRTLVEPLDVLPTPESVGRTDGHHPA